MLSSLFYFPQVTPAMCVSVFCLAFSSVSTFSSCVFVNIHVLSSVWPFLDCLWFININGWFLYQHIFSPFPRQMTYFPKNKFPFIIFAVSLNKIYNSKGVISVPCLLCFYQLAQNLSDLSPFFWWCLQNSENNALLWIPSGEVWKSKCLKLPRNFFSVVGTWKIFIHACYIQELRFLRDFILQGMCNWECLLSSKSYHSMSVFLEWVSLSTVLFKYIFKRMVLVAEEQLSPWWGKCC